MKDTTATWGAAPTAMQCFVVMIDATANVRFEVFAMANMARQADDDSMVLFYLASRSSSGLVANGLPHDFSLFGRANSCAPYTLSVPRC